MQHKETSVEEPTASPPITAAPAEIQRPNTFPWKSIVLIAITIVLTVALLYIPKDLIDQLGDFGYLGVFLVILVSSATLVLPTPGIGIVLAAGGAQTLNPTLVGLAAGLGAGIGEITGFMAGMGGSEFAQRSRFYPPIERYVKRWGIATIFVLSLIPSPAFDLAGIAAGTMGMSFWKFLLSCTIGKTIRYIGLAWLGRYLPQLFG